MRIGMTLPVMEPDLNRKTLKAWVEQIDQGPWQSLALGERIAFVNPEFIAMLSACAAWTETVELITTICVLPMHDPVWAAKKFATIDMLSEGRLTVGVGVGGREEDYRSVGVDFSQRKLKNLENAVKTMQQVWRGENLFPENKRIVEPLPVQKNGPQILVGAMGPKSIQSCARYSSGITGFSFSASLDEINNNFIAVRNAWKEQGRTDKPRLITSFWYAVNDDKEKAREQVTTHLRRYLNFMPDALVEQLLPSTGFAGTAAELKQFVNEIKALGADDLILVPTSANIDDMTRIESLLF